MKVSPAKPSYLEYRIPPDTLSVVVRAQSSDDLCGVLSVQDVKVLICVSLYATVLDSLISYLILMKADDQLTTDTLVLHLDYTN